MVAMEAQTSRAERLRALREAAGLDTSQQEVSGGAVESSADQILKFRSYSVKDDKISHEKAAVANPPKYEQPVVEEDMEAEGEVSHKVAEALH